MTREFDEALQRARMHLRKATLEGLEAAGALVDAARVASGALEADSDSLTGQIARSLDDLIHALREGQGLAFPTALTRPLSEALDAEIARWEQRSRTDPDARPVLRAFLGLRELLWELGLVREAPQPPGASAPKPTDATRSRRGPEPERKSPRKPRVQRFDIEH